MRASKELKVAKTEELKFSFGFVDTKLVWLDIVNRSMLFVDLKEVLEKKVPE